MNFQYSVNGYQTREIQCAQNAREILHLLNTCDEILQKPIRKCEDRPKNALQPAAGHRYSKESTEAAASLLLLTKVAVF